jgi:hypothetical protein
MRPDWKFLLAGAVMDVSGDDIRSLTGKGRCGARGGERSWRGVARAVSSAGVLRRVGRERHFARAAEAC